MCSYQKSKNQLSYNTLPSSVTTYSVMARAFDSTPKKLAIPLFGLFFIGLIVFTAGFGLLLSSKEEDDVLKVESNNKKSCLLSILHDSSWWDIGCSTRTPSCCPIIRHTQLCHWCPVYYSEYHLLCFSRIFDHY